MSELIAYVRDLFMEYGSYRICCETEAVADFDGSFLATLEAELEVERLGLEALITRAEKGAGNGDYGTDTAGQEQGS